MVNVNKLKGKLREYGYSLSVIANKLGMDRSTLYRKLKNYGKGILIKEAKQIIDILKLTNEDAIAIFFAHNIA